MKIQNDNSNGGEGNFIVGNSFLFGAKHYFRRLYMMFNDVVIRICGGGLRSRALLKELWRPNEARECCSEPL